MRLVADGGKSRCEGGGGRGGREAREEGGGEVVGKHGVQKVRKQLLQIKKYNIHLLVCGN